MYKYEGLLIHESHDDEGIIEVIEHKGVRSMHFGSQPRQSSMLLSDPDKLELGYVRAMTSWLLFKPTLEDDALIVGLGGGSLTRHLLQHFPECRLKAIEYRKSVVKIARSHFALPLDSRLKIVVADGGDYIRQRTESYREHYSLLFVDAFDHEGIASSICCEAFFDACKALLKKMVCWSSIFGAVPIIPNFSKSLCGWREFLAGKPSTCPFVTEATSLDLLLMIIYRFIPSKS